MKKLLSLILILTISVSAFSVGCNDQPPTGTPSASAPAETSEETPVETPAETPSETDPVSPPEPEYDLPPEDGTLLFCEDFENVEIGLNGQSLIDALGWTRLGSKNSSYDDSSAYFVVKELNGSHALYIENYRGNTPGVQAHLEILSSEQFAFLHERNYTYQYDVTYTNAYAGSDYINIISEHGGGFYNTFHMRNAGYAHNQCCISGTFYRYALTYTDGNSVVTKLLGKKYNSGIQALSDITVSVRYVVDWKNGNSVYVRTFSELGATPGEWVLVSGHDPSQPGAEYFTPDAGGAAIVLKVSSGQNGYIDNIKIWSGIGDEPDTAEAYLESSAECHRFVYDGIAPICVLCGKYEDAISLDWDLKDVPAYDGGKVSEATYVSGQGIDTVQVFKNEDLMQLVSDTNSKEFENYLTKLKEYGFEKEFRRDADGNIFASYVKNGIRVYAYYLCQRHEARIIRELTSVSASLEDFGYVYEKQADDQTVVYQYSMAMRDGTHFKADGYYDNGMFYIIKLADNSLMLIDGGRADQFPESQVDNLMKMLREITGTKDGETIRIAAWYITHPHGDHYGGFKSFSAKYGSNFDLERVFFGFPSTNIDYNALNSGASTYKAIINVINSYYSDDDTEFLRIHTGQTFSIADVTVDVLYTHEDGVDAVTGSSVLSEVNNASSVIKITVDGKTILFLGDANVQAMNLIILNWKGETFVSDAVQLAHHVLNDLSILYHIVKASVIFSPQSLHRIQEHKVCPIPFGVAKRYARQDMIFFQNEYTVGIAVVNGQFEKVYELPVIYDIVK